MGDLETKNALIKSARLSREDHGVLTFTIELDYGGACQGFGGYVLYTPRHPGDVTGVFLWRVMDIAGIDNFNQLAGRTIRVRANYSGVYSIGHILKDDWFTPSVDLVHVLEKKQ